MTGQGFLTGDSELAKLIAAFDWASTPIGPIETWPPSLTVTTGMILRSHVPIVTLWGPEGVMIYNDAYSVFAGNRHPQLLGSNVREGWPEVADFNDNVMKVVLAGGTLKYNDLELELNRRGRLEKGWMDLDYSPVLDEQGQPWGVIAIVVETTSKVLAEAEVRAATVRQQQILDSAIDYAIIASDIEGKVSHWNEGARRILGWTEAEMLGQHFARFFTPEDRANGRPERELKLALKTGRAWDEGWRVRKSGERFWAHGEMAPIRDEGGQAVGFVKVLRDRTEEHRAEDQLRRAQEAGGVGVFSIDIADNVLRGTPEFCRIFGLEPKDSHLASVVEAMVIPEDATVVSNEERRRTGQATLDVEYRIRRPDGQERTIARRAEYERDVDGRPIRMVGVVQDVTEKRAVQRALEESEAQFRTFAQVVPNQIWTSTPDGKLDWFNARVYTYAGAKEGSLDGDGWTRLVHPEDLPATAEQWAQALASGRTYETEFRLQREDGTFNWHLARAVPMRNAEGAITRWIGANTNIHRRKMAETENVRDRDRMWAMSQDILLVCDLQGVITAINPSATRLLGWEQEEMVGRRIDEFVHPEDVLNTVGEVAKLGQGAPTLAFENRYRTKSGDYRLLDWTAVPDGDRVHGVGRDITHERALARNQERIWTLSPVLKVVASAADGSIQSVNPAWTQVLGWTLEQTVGRLWSDLIPPEEAAAGRDPLERLQSGQTVMDRELSLVSADGGLRRIAWTIVPENGVLYGFGRDVTEQRTVEEALRQSQKMEAVGQLTGGIAHDFNNLLQGITGSLDLVQRRISQGRLSELDRFINGAMTSANRAAALTHRLLAFSRRQPLDPRAVRANPLVSSMEDLLRRTLGERIELGLVLAGGLWLTRCDPNQLESAILNLAINARDAMPEGGKLVIETCNAHLDSAYSARQRDLRPGQYVCICVTDTGTGMTPETVARAFEPFFTTKPIGQGTGLGLSMIYGFARQSEGYAKIYSELGKGTTLKLYLPRYRGPADDDHDDSLNADIRASETGETVLVVEDEPVVRGLIIEVLSDLGYDAIEAADGPSGLEILQSKRKIDLLVTDVGLPGLNGRQMADAGRKLRPDLKILFMTGYAENAALASGFLEPGMAMITKPFAMEVLATRIRAIITGEPGAL